MSTTDTPIVEDDATLLADRATTGDQPRTPPLPRWVTAIRDHQITAVGDILEAFRHVDVVFLDAPTGAGKTLIAELVRRALAGGGGEWAAVDAAYICSDKQLQDQFANDFPYARVLKGRANYPTQRTLEGKSSSTADDCSATSADGRGCWHCDGYRTCPYQIAKADAAEAPLAVLNTAYFLTEANLPNSHFGGKAKRELVVIDEADTLEDMLMNYVEFTVPAWIGKAVGLEWPKKAARKSTIIRWLQDAADKTGGYIENGGARDAKERRRLVNFKADCLRVAEEVQRDVDAAGDEDTDENTQSTGRWLRDYDTQTFTLKPVVVGPYGARRLWRHGRKFLLMSGTIISADEMAESLGLPYEYETVTVPMTFPLEHRPIIVAPVADIKRGSSDDDYANLAYAVDRISELHQGERVLVHTVSFKLAQRLMEDCDLHGRKVFSYSSGRNGVRKQEALDGYLRTPNAIMFAPSMDRGVDLPGDACRVVIVAKVPFPSLGDRRISARMRLPGGQSWYSVQTVRKIVQMTGRGVRSAEDYAVSYILDAQFSRNVYAKSKGLFPGWWREALRSNGDVRWLMRGWDGRVQQPTADDIWQRTDQ